MIQEYDFQMFFEKKIHLIYNTKLLEMIMTTTICDIDNYNLSREKNIAVFR